jgi:hypothetical protein
VHHVGSTILSNILWHLQRRYLKSHFLQLEARMSCWAEVLSQDLIKSDVMIYSCKNVYTNSSARREWTGLSMEEGRRQRSLGSNNFLRSMASSLVIRNALHNTDCYGTLIAQVAHSTSWLLFKMDVLYKTIQRYNSERYYVCKTQSLTCVQLLYKFFYSYF